MSESTIYSKSENACFEMNIMDCNYEPIKIDYILVNKLDEKNYINERAIFEKNLIEKGLIIRQLESTDHERFIQIHVPNNVLLQYCEIMKLRMPLKKFGKKENNISGQFARNRSYLFDVASDNFITPSIRYMIINFILEHTKFKDDLVEYNIDNDIDSDDEDQDGHKFGITKLILKNAYCGAYPLHDNEKRQELMKTWGIHLSFYKCQPLDELKSYFGIKIALYFAWLEFYNVMLMIASAISLLYLFIGLLLSYSNKIGDEICNGNETFYMCPQCDKKCEIWDLKEICSYTTLLFILNNSITIGYGILMALWSAIFLNMWNQYSARVIQKWGVANDDYFFDDDMPTKDYLRSKNNQKYCSRRFPKIMISFSVVLFWICIVLAVLAGMIFYRITLYTSEWLYGEESQIFKSTIVEVTGAILDLISILILNHIYSKIALKLTEQELHRTHNQFEESLMWKYYIFWFINYYSSFFYIAFLKGRFAGTPQNYNRIFGYRQEECGTRGCIVDLFIQMAVVMIGDMTYNNLIEYLIPYIRKRIRASKLNHKCDSAENLICNQWIQDYNLLYWGSTETSMEYLEMVLQYGLVTLFVTAFPFGPICALINNIIEIRMDARNLITNFRRPIAQNVKNIGIWIPIMEAIVNLSVLSNACIIAFTTNFIPELVYRLYASNNQSYVDFSLSRINTNDLDSIVISGNYKVFNNTSECRYVGYYNPPEHSHKYELSQLYWHILAVRLIFVLLFQNFVNFLKIVIKSLVPPMPKKLKANIINQMKRTQRLIINEETKERIPRRKTLH